MTPINKGKTQLTMSFLKGIFQDFEESSHYKDPYASRFGECCLFSDSVHMLGVTLVERFLNITGVPY